MDSGLKRSNLDYSTKRIHAVSNLNWNLNVSLPCTFVSVKYLFN